MSTKRSALGKMIRIAAPLALLAALVAGGAQSLRSSPTGPSYEDLSLLTNVLHLVRQHYVKDVDEHQLVEGALKGMLDTLDPHTSYLSRDLYKEMQRDTKGEFEGLGIEITKGDGEKGDGFVTVVAPIDGTPAALAGLQAKDQIVAVCPDATEKSCKGTQDMNLLEAVKMMRGPRGTKIMIQILRSGWNQPKPFIIKRASIRVSSVQLHMIEKDLPYVRISQFQERTAEDLQDALKLAHAKAGGPLRGLVLDLRDNPGGLLDQAVKVGDVWLESGLIVFSEGRSGGNRMEWHAKREGTEGEYPMIVLVNGGSASASEIVSGALQDHKRALLLGSQTFGKGSVQTIIPLEDGSGLRLTTALYYLPSGRSIQEVRVQPDVLVEPFSEAELTAAQESRTQERRRSTGEVDLEGHFENKPGAGAGAKETAPIPEPIAEPEGEPANTEEAKEARFQQQLGIDRQLTRAVELLKSWTIFSKLTSEGGA
ncbi:MAG: S41 family peptidase [Deltaproteobacteria bacterium]|nr:S41 family peptidase [Deltaproteobacteria bacterium]